MPGQAPDGLDPWLQAQAVSLRQVNDVATSQLAVGGQCLQPVLMPFETDRDHTTALSLHHLDDRLWHTAAHGSELSPSPPSIVQRPLEASLQPLQNLQETSPLRMPVPSELFRHDVLPNPTNVHRQPTDAGSSAKAAGGVEALPLPTKLYCDDDSAGTNAHDMLGYYYPADTSSAAETQQPPRYLDNQYAADHTDDVLMRSGGGGSDDISTHVQEFPSISSDSLSVSAHAQDNNTTAEDDDNNASGQFYAEHPEAPQQEAQKSILPSDESRTSPQLASLVGQWLDVSAASHAGTAAAAKKPAKQESRWDAISRIAAGALPSSAGQSIGAVIRGSYNVGVGKPAERGGGKLSASVASSSSRGVRGGADFGALSRPHVRYARNSMEQSKSSSSESDSGGLMILVIVSSLIYISSSWYDVR